MAFRGEERVFTDFSGGMKPSFGTHGLQSNEAALVKNIYIGSGGFIEKRRGDTEFNGTTMSAGKAVTCVGSYLPTSGTEYLMAICDTKIFKSEMDGTMDDISAALTISSSDNNLWTFSQMNDLAIFVGGAPNAPIKWSGTGNAAVLGGTPPQGKFGFQVNNRFFIGNTSANPSRIYWSVLGNPEDWSGAGSGSQDISTNDGDELVGAAVLSNDVVLLFKQNSVHQMVVRTAPFPVYPLFPNVGCVARKGIVVTNGLAYWLTPRAKMYATDGTNLISLPNDDIDDIQDGLNLTRLKYAQAIKHVGQGYSHLIWCVSDAAASTNNLALIWDVDSKCWLQHTSGYDCNALATTQANILYGGHYDGKIYKKDVASTYTDASEGGAAIEGLWRSGWLTNNSFLTASVPSVLTVSLETQTAGSLRVAYGFDYASDTVTEDVDMTSTGSLWGTGVWGSATWGGAGFTMKSVYLKGIGNTFQSTFYNSTASQKFRVDGYSLSYKRASQKAMNAT